MKQKLALMITAAAICLTGCAAPAEKNTAQEVRAYFGNAQCVTLNYDLTADCGGRIYGFDLRYEESGGDGTLTVLSPESIKGLTAVCAADREYFEFDGASFETGELFSGDISPVSACRVMLYAWKNGYASERSHESVDGISVEALYYELEGGAGLKTWFDRETLLPVRAEITDGGRTVITAEFGDVITE